MMSELYDEILSECDVRGEKDRDKSRCLYAKVFECSEANCPQALAFHGKRPADMLTERYNLKKQYAEEMA